MQLNSTNMIAIEPPVLSGKGYRSHATGAWVHQVRVGSASFIYGSADELRQLAEAFADLAATAKAREAVNVAEVVA